MDRLDRRGLGLRAARQHRVRRVAEHREHAGVAERGQARAVDLAARVLARRVELVVAGVDDHARARGQREGGRVGNRVRDADDLGADVPDLDDVAGRHGDERGHGQVVLGQLRLDHRDRERQRDDAADGRAGADQVRERGDVDTLLRYLSGATGKKITSESWATLRQTDRATWEQAHEVLARTGEAYVMHGEAPTVALRTRQV